MVSGLEKASCGTFSLRKYALIVVKIEDFKVLIFFSYFCSKHRLCALVRTALPRQF